MGADRRYRYAWCVYPVHRKRRNAAADLAIPLPGGSRFGRRHAQLHQSRRGIYTALKPAGGGWVAVHRASARRGVGRIARVATDRCGWLAIVVLYRWYCADHSVDRDDSRTARFNRVPGDAWGGLVEDSGPGGSDQPDR